jgi:O-glycosyl hydrolase
MRGKTLFFKTFLLAAFASLFACQTSGEKKQTNIIPEVSVDINVISKETYQVMEHFGASDAWSAQFVGMWPEEKKNAIAELLFSNQADADGNPKGIGLSLWRFNVGAGSASQGDQSGIRDEWRRAESFLNADGSYDWSKQAGQVWFAKASQEFGVDKLLIFPNSPPVSMTKTGKAYANDGQSNLSVDNYHAFGEYLAQVIMGLGEKGLNVDYVSPVNEPQWDWSDGGQEGTPFWNDEIAGIVKSTDKALEKNNLTTKIDVAEAGKINYLYEQADKSGRGGQITDFFKPESANFIGDLKHVSRSISAHSYFTTSPFESAVQQRASLNSALNTVGDLSYWMSEYCILGDNGGEINGSGRDLGIDPALYLARVIHNDLTVANASAWHWWLAISPYDYKDGLIYIDKNKDDGAFYESKMLWALGNFSRFIRPGYQRISLKVNNKTEQNQDLLASAYLDPHSGNLVIVVVNSSNEEAKLNLEGDLENLSGNLDGYLTDKDHNLAYQEYQPENIHIPAQSIMTLRTQKP